MARNKSADRQTVLAADLRFGFGVDVTNDLEIKLPPNCLLLRGAVEVVTAFNSQTTATLTVTDGTVTFLNATDLKTNAATAFSTPTVFYPSGGTLSFNIAETGTAATAGDAFVWVEYIAIGRANETYDA